MQFSISTLVLALAALTTAQNAGGRPTPSGACCVAKTNEKQDACNAAAGVGRCVPGGGNVNCNGALSCVAQSALVCDANIIERGKSLCRAKNAAGGIIDGVNVVQSLSQVKLN